MNRLAIMTLVALGIAGPASSEPMPFDIDPNHSRIWFDVNHQGYSIMRGLFRDFSGTFNFDADDPTASSLDIMIDAASVNMFHEGLNDHLKRDDFFGVETHPQLHFVRTGVEVMGDNMVCEDMVAGARWLEDLGCDYVIHHIGYDERRGIAARGHGNSIDDRRHTGPSGLG